MSQLELRPGLADVPVAESAISFIDGKRARLEYRGVAVETLARDSCFEETAWLLLKGELPTQRELVDPLDALRSGRQLARGPIIRLHTKPQYRQRRQHGHRNGKDQGRTAKAD